MELLQLSVMQQCSDHMPHISICFVIFTPFKSLAWSCKNDLQRCSPTQCEENEDVNNHTCINAILNIPRPVYFSKVYFPKSIFQSVFFQSVFYQSVFSLSPMPSVIVILLRMVVELYHQKNCWGWWERWVKIPLKMRFVCVTLIKDSTPLIQFVVA